MFTSGLIPLLNINNKKQKETFKSFNLQITEKQISSQGFMFLPVFKHGYLRSLPAIERNKQTIETPYKV